jgi:hypothetical protein
MVKTVLSAPLDSKADQLRSREPRSKQLLGRRTGAQFVTLAQK